MSVYVTGMDNALQLISRVVVATSGPNLIGGTESGAQVAAQGMRMRAPKDTRLLEGSLGVLPETESGPTRATAHAGVTDGEAFYWHFQEWGTSKMEANPYARPTADEDEPEIVMAVAKHIARSLV